MPPQDGVPGPGGPRPLQLSVERSGTESWDVRLEGIGDPVSRHPSEGAARAAMHAYRSGLASPTGDWCRLADGSVVVVRQVRPADKPAFLDAWQRFGATSRHTRFLGFKKRLTLSDLRYLTEIDHVDHEAFVALAPIEDSRQIAVARYIRDDRLKEAAEVAVAVADDWQGRGVGGELLQRLARNALESGIEVFTACVLADNTAMLRAFRRVGDVTIVRRDGATREIDVRLLRPKGWLAPPQARRASRRA